MASAITIQIGALTATYVPPVTDAKVSSTLLKFYDAYQLGPDTATNQEKLNAILKWFVIHVRGKAVQKAIEDLRATDQATAEATYGLE